MKNLEKILKKAKLKNVPESLDKEMELLFSEYQKPSNTKKMIFYIISTGIAASLALAFLLQISHTNKTQPDNTITTIENPTKFSKIKPKVKIVKISNNFAELFGVPPQEETSFFDSEKSTIARISIK